MRDGASLSRKETAAMLSYDLLTDPRSKTAANDDDGAETPDPGLFEPLVSVVKPPRVFAHLRSYAVPRPASR